MTADIMDGIPSWVNHVAVCWTVFSILATTIATWLSKVLPPPEEINSRWYSIVFGIIHRISISGRRVENGNGTASENK